MTAGIDKFLQLCEHCCHGDYVMFNNGVCIYLPRPWEVECSYEGVADLRRHYDASVKNPGHQKFIPVDQFTVEHLPAGYRDQDLVVYIRAVSDLTVRETVKYVSEHRPETVPGSDQPYPCYNNRGSNVMRVGTGWISGVRKFPNVADEDVTCPCKEYLNSPTPEKQFACIYIHTAAHVVFDKLEGEHTTCHLFFDRGCTPDVCNDVVTLSGMSDVSRSVDTDYCEMMFATHDMDLIDKLDTMVNDYKEMSNIISKKYAKPVFSTVSDFTFSYARSKTLTIIVSHPQVSVGQLSKRDNKVDWSKNAQTILICPESGDADMLVTVIKKPMHSICSPHLTFALIVTAAIFCAITAVLTGIILVDTYHDPQICINCVHLKKDNSGSTEFHPMFNVLEKRWEDDVEKCCGVTSQQVSAMLELINREHEMRAIIRHISAHKQLHAPAGEEYLTEPLFNDQDNVALLMSDKNDPLTEHAHGVNVTEDALIIQHSGLYYVYSSVHYKPVSDRPAGDFKYQNWYHYVHRTSANNPSNSGLILQTAHSVCLKCIRNEETAFAGGTFYLEVDDKIHVWYSGLGLVHISKQSTFVGLFMIDSGSAKIRAN